MGYDIRALVSADPIDGNFIGGEFLPGPSLAATLPGTSGEHYDAIVIGSGQGGTPLCQALAGAGMRTALVEREHVGGTCVNEGCTPTKTMVASARVAYLARRGADYGVHAGPVTIDMTKVRQRKRDIVESFRRGSERAVTSTEGVELLMGEACFTG